MKRLALTIFLTLTLVAVLPALLQAEAKSGASPGQNAPQTKTIFKTPDSHTTVATPQVSLWKVYANSDPTLINSLIRTNDGGFAVAGHKRNTADETFIFYYKVGKDGSLGWQRGEKIEGRTGGLALHDDWAFIVQYSDGGYGLFDSRESGNVFTKLNYAGAKRWQNDCYPATIYMDPFTTIPTSAKGLALVVRHHAEDPYPIFVVPLDEDCQQIWGGGTYSDNYFSGLGGYNSTPQEYKSAFYGTPLVQIADGSYVVAARGDISTYQGKTTGGDTTLQKLTPQGQKAWKKKFLRETYKFNLASMIQNSDGGFTLGGTLGLHPDPPTISVMKLDSAGNLLWQRNHELDGLNLINKGNLDEYTQSIVQMDDGGYAVAFALPPAKIHVMKVSGTGGLRWHQTIDFDQAISNEFTHPWIFADGKELIVAANIQKLDGSDYGLWFWKLVHHKRMPQTKILNPNKPARKKLNPGNFKIIPRR